MAGKKPQLGAPTDYPDRYAPELLLAIPRGEGRSSLELPKNMTGRDLWTAFEVSWLEPSGKPRVAIAEFAVACDSDNIVESKSFKLYLNSLNQEVFDSEEQLREVLRRDLSAAFGGTLSVTLFSVDAYTEKGLTPMEGDCIDDLDVTCADTAPAPMHLASAGEPVTETLHSHLLKTNCPVTGQPDWASVAIHYRGPAIDRGGLLRYLVSFRRHQDFHENCVERIFSDLLVCCQPRALAVNARYTRRGGLDINPYRATAGLPEPRWQRLARQ